MVEGGRKRVAQRYQTENCKQERFLIDTVMESGLMAVEEDPGMRAGGRAGGNLGTFVGEGVELAVVGPALGYDQWRGRSWICGQT